jgi:hypothetical protein
MLGFVYWIRGDSGPDNFDISNLQLIYYIMIPVLDFLKNCLYLPIFLAIWFPLLVLEKKNVNCRISGWIKNGDWELEDVSEIDKPIHISTAELLMINLLQ